MINFKEELLKYEPIMEVDEIENSIYSDSMQDMFDILQHITQQKDTITDKE